MSAASAALRLVWIGAYTALCFLPCLVLGLIERAGAHRFGMHALAHLQSHWSRVMLRLLGFELDVVQDGDRPRVGAAVVAANHLSHIDILVVSAVFPSRFIAKSEIRRWPLIGPVAALAGTLFIKRGDRKDVPRVVAEMQRTLAAGVSVTFFPEGWASRGLEVHHFHRGLFQAPAEGAIPCLPVALSYSTPAHQPAPAWTVAWWGPVPIFRHLWRMMRTGPVTARVAFPAEPLVDRDRKQLAERLQAAVAAHFVPLRQTPVPPPLPGDPDPDEAREVVD